jgi:DNA polymerase (family 10)
VLPGLGPERGRELKERLGVSSLQELEEAARDGKISELSGFGEKTEQNILEAIEQDRSTEKRTRISIAEQAARSLEEYLGGIEGVGEAVVAGSYRRRRETVGDLDAVASSKNNAEIMERFVEYEDVQEVLSRGEERTSVMLRSGLQVDLRAVPEESFGTALLYFTGSQPHHVTLRDVNLKRDLKFNEYGLFKGDERVAGKTEEEVYEELGFSYIEPELITEGDIRGNLHSHTNATDGNDTLEEMARAAKERGYDYLALSATTPSASGWWAVSTRSGCGNRWRRSIA